MRDIRSIYLNPQPSLLLFGGGLDSSYLAAVLADAKCAPVHYLFFDYSQKALEGELRAAKLFALRYGALLKVVTLSLLEITQSNILLGGPLADDPQANILEGRNAIFLTIAGTYAANAGLTDIYLGSDCGPVPFPDSTRDAIAAYQRVLSVCYRPPLKVHAPLLTMTKDEIIHAAAVLDPAILANAFTCYEGGLRECGACSHCLNKARVLAKWGIYCEYPPDNS